MDTIPLLPLTTVLFPLGRLPLQIFEPRYLELVSRCLKNDEGFGVVWLREGSEVYKVDGQANTKLAQIGTYAHIVDWDSLANGLLGITIEGGKKFRVISSYQQDNHLQMAEVEWVDSEPLIELPDQSEDMKGLLTQLLEHPHIERLQLRPQVNDIGSLSLLLAQLLPIEESMKFTLLSMTDPLQRMDRLMELLEQYSE